MMPDDFAPRELIRQRYALEGNIAPLAELLKLNPYLADEIIVLAMVLGIHAEERRAFDQKAADMMQPLLKTYSWVK